MGCENQGDDQKGENLIQSASMILITWFFARMSDIISEELEHLLGMVAEVIVGG